MRHLIIDTDPGIDDSLALLLAARSPEVNLVGVTTVYGNHTVKTTTRNALAVLALVGRADVPVAAGAKHPVSRPFAGARDSVHGDRGLGDAELPPSPRAPEAMPAYEFIIEQARRAPGELTLLAIAPLTNLALALHAEPRLAQWVAGVILMGGAYTLPGNITPLAEANIYHDPEAAQAVFSAEWPIVALGLDVTLQATLTDEDVASFGRRGTPVGDFCARALPFYQRFYRDHKAQHEVPLHDPAAVCYAIDPTLFQTRRAQVTIETQDGPTLGRSRAEFVDGESARVDVVTHLNVPHFRQLLLTRLQ